jgi:putative endonuclease
MEKSLIKSLDVFRVGEEEACNFLRKNKCKILDRNYSVLGGEIDIVARHGNTILFVEVKTRVSDAFAKPYESVGFKKQNHLKTAAKTYVQEKPVRNCEFRFDVISIVLDESLKPKIEWIQDAF